jgi:cell division protein FtsB
MELLTTHTRSHRKRNKNEYENGKRREKWIPSALCFLFLCIYMHLYIHINSSVSLYYR